MIRLKRFLKKRNGMTLIEVVVSLALLGLVAVSVCGVLVLAGRVMALNAVKTRQSNSAAGKIETGGDSGETDSATLTINSGSDTVTVNGSYVNEKDGSVNYWTFKPSS